MNEIDRLLQLVKTQGHDVWVGGPATEPAVAKLQAVMGVTLPISLRQFLNRYGALGVDDNFLSGVIDENQLSETAGSIYGDTMCLRADSNIPNPLWAIQCHEEGAYCMDISRPTQNGEFAIVNYEYSSTQHDKILAESYADFVCQWFLKGWTTEPE